MPPRPVAGPPRGRPPIAAEGPQAYRVLGGADQTELSTTVREALRRC
ncbi:hypothetical protein [Streptomyces sp. CoH27]|nr:hypothetical protein [Streptomyces sp. CoH27]